MTDFFALLALALFCLAVGLTAGVLLSPRRLVIGRLDQIVALLLASAQREGQTMTLLEKLRAAVLAANEATNNIAADIAGLKDKIVNGITPEEGAALATEFDDLVTRLQGVAADTPDADPGSGGGTDSGSGS